LQNDVGHCTDDGTLRRCEGLAIVLTLGLRFCDRTMKNIIWRQTLGDVLRRSAARTPDKLALQCGSVSWSYAEFDRLCNRLAWGLRGIGIGPGDRIAILARNSHAFPAVRFALARLGAVLVPINFMLVDTEVAYILRHAEATVLCTDPEHAAVGRRAAALDTSVAQFVLLPDEDNARVHHDGLTFQDLLTACDSPPESDAQGDSLAQIIYTSGTESRPKGAMLSHQAVMWQYTSCLADAEIAHGDLFLHAFPMYHCAQLDAFLGPCLYAGASNVITSKPTPDNLLKLLEEYEITSFFAPPTIWIALLRSTAFATRDLSRLRKGYYGASSMPVEVLREIRERLPQMRLWNLYGQTEIAPVATVLRPEDSIRKAGSAGRAVLNVETRVVDEAGEDVAPGEIGEVVHRSPQLMSGYFKDEERTREAFRHGWFHSGDLARIDAEGYITIVDRKKDMINSGGENVASREVEEIIYALPAVAEVAVIGVPHARWIEAVVAVVVVKREHLLAEEAVVAHCRSYMAHFKVPKRVILTESLPKNPSGKILKRELRERFAAVLQEQ
jgi:fatty-acyl-CoA synthase